jgi:hypothetical protein
MARIGAFDRHLEPLAWWEAELIPAGWYVDELLVEPASGVTGTLTATLGSATLSATGTGPATSSAILIPSSNNPSYKAGFYSPRRGGTPKYASLWDGCVGAWAPSLGQTGLTSFVDQSLYQNNGAASRAASYWVVSSGKTALLYNLPAAKTTIDNALVPISGSLTLSFWFFNTNNFTGYSTPFDTGVSTSTRACSVFFGPNNDSVYCAFGEPAGGGGNVGSGMNLQLSTWTHLAVTVSGTTATIYKNGVSFGSTSSGVVGSTWTNNRRITLGENPSGGQLFAGYGDDYRLYNRALTPYEIKLLALRRGIAYERASRKLPVSSAAAPTGSVSSTLANATLSSSGTLASGLSGSLSAVLADATLSATGTLTNAATGSLSSTLADASLSSSGTVAAGASGTLTRTLDAATLASSGTVGSGVTATVSVTLAAATLSASGTLAAGLSGTVTRTLDNASLSASGTLAAGLTGSTNSTLANATLSSTGTVAAGASGTVTSTLDNATLSATGGAAGSVTGSVSSTLAAVTCSSSATLAAGLSGTVTRTLADVVSSATGTVAAGASGSVTRTLADSTLVSTGSFSAGLTASVNRALDSCVVSSSATVANGATGSLSVQLASATLQSGNVALGGFRLKVAGEWKDAMAFVKVTGTWKSATPFVKVGGVWE